MSYSPMHQPDHPRTVPTRSILRSNADAPLASTSHLEESIPNLHISYTDSATYRGGASPPRHKPSTMPNMSGNRILRPPPSSRRWQGNLDSSQPIQTGTSAAARADRSQPLHSVDIQKGYEQYLIPAGPGIPSTGISPYINMGSSHPTIVYPGRPLSRPKGEPPDVNCEFRKIRMERWLAGDCTSSVYHPPAMYMLIARIDGPVLTARTAGVLSVEPLINPLLMPPNGDGGIFVRWNMLYPTSYASPSSSLSAELWTERLREPATFPRLSSLHVISRGFPWSIPIHAAPDAAHVTCFDVIEQIHKFLYRFIPKLDTELASREHLQAIRAAFRVNRTPPDGLPGRLLNEELFNGPKRVEWLCECTAFMGIDRDIAYIQHRVSAAVPGLFVLLCGRPSDEDASIRNLTTVETIPHS